MSATIPRPSTALLLVWLAALAACAGDGDPAPRGPGGPAAFQEPGWWHHFHGDSRSTDRLASGHDGAARLERAWSWREGTAAFLGAVLSRDQKTLYVTSSEDPPAHNFHALDAETGRVRWTFPLDPWATFSGGLVGPDDTVYVADSRFVFAIRPPASPGGGAPREIWRSPHRHVSLSLGFTPAGELFEVTLDGQVNVFDRSTGERLASVDALPGEKSLRPGVGIPDDLRSHPRLLEMGADVPDQARTGLDGAQYLVPGHVVYLWDAMRETGLVSSVPGLAEAFLDTCFGGVFVSNTPSIVRVGEERARIFLATIGEFIPPAGPAAPGGDEIVYPVFGRDHPEAAARGAYTGYLQVIDWDRSRRSLEVLDPPIVLDAPSGTTAGIGPPGPDGEALVFLAGGHRLYAFRAGGADLRGMPREPRWVYNAGMDVAGSPTVFRGGEVEGGRPGTAVAVLSGFSGMSMVQDDPGGGDCEAGACRLVYETNTLPYEGRRRAAMEAGEPALVALGTSVPEAAGRYTYVQFTEGPGAVNLFDRLGMFSYKGYLPLRSVLAVVESRTGEIVQQIPVEEAQVCDSALSTTGWVYAVYTSGIDQIKHVIYPSLFPRPKGGVVAFRPAGR